MKSDLIYDTVVLAPLTKRGVEIYNEYWTNKYLTEVPKWTPVKEHYVVRAKVKTLDMIFGHEILRAINQR